MSSDKFILAIDLGSSGPKVALVSTRGEIVASEFEPVGRSLREVEERESQVEYP